MSKELKIAVIAHSAGLVLAGLLAWFELAWIGDAGWMPGDDVFPLQMAAIVLVEAFGIYALWQMIRGQDELANKTKKHFDSKQQR